MHNWSRMVAAVVGMAGAALLASLPASAAPATGVEDVIAALGLDVTSEAADYVVMVDTSGSMNAGGRYDSVRRELGKLVDSLDSDDRVSLLTFDTKAKSRFRGLVGANRSAVLAGLPATAKGKHTDLGTAIASGLTELERADTRRLAALILITDGVLDAPGSDYESVKSPAWKSLRTRAAGLSAEHQVAAYAVSLQASTDAGLLKKVFPDAREVSASQVGERFSHVGEDLVLLRAAEILNHEVSQPLTVSWAGDLGTALAKGTPVDVQLTISSVYPHVPVTLSEFAPRPTPGLQVELSGLPDSVEIAPGGSTTLTATARVTGTGGGDAAVGLSAKIGSPWLPVMEGDLGMTFAPELSGTAPVPAAPIELPPTLVPVAGGIAGLLAGVVLVLLLARMLTTPVMSGLLTFRRDGRDVAEIVLKGRRMKLVAPTAAIDLTGLRGSARGARGASAQEPAVRVDVKLGETTARGLVHDGGSVPFGDLELRYTSGRRRILDKIGLPRPDAEG